MAYANAVEELSAIPFSSLIGGPLDAAIKAQSQAAVTTITFIKEVGLNFTNTTMAEIRKVAFSYFKADQNGVTRKYDLEVPLLTIVPIPYIRIETIDINFKATLTDTVATNEEVKTQLDFATSGSGGFAFFKAGFRMSASKTSATTKSTNATREYIYDLSLHAVQDEMPGGLGKVLGILESLVKDGTESAGLGVITKSNFASGTLTLTIPTTTTTLPTGASIKAFYTTDGTTPTVKSTSYATGIAGITAETTVKAIAWVVDASGNALNIMNPSPMYEEVIKP